MAAEYDKLLNDYNLLLIRYTGEIWLKSTKVKMRMIHILMDNIKKMLEKKAIHYHKYQLSKDATRIFFFFNNKDLPRAIKTLSKTFGVYSISPAIRTSNRMKNIIERTLEVGAKILTLEDTFALRVKRSGDHDFSSQDVARKAGKAILDHFPNLNLQVDLGAPKKIIYIEVRGEFSYIFTDIIISKWKGLPIKETRKVLVMDIGRQYDLLAGMFLMRRGCKIKPILFKITDNQEEWNKRISNWREIVSFTPLTTISAFQLDLTESLNIVRKKLDSTDSICSLCRLMRFKVIGRLLEDESPELQDYMAVTDGFTHNNISLCPDETDLQTMVFCDKLLMTPLIGFAENKINTYLSYISDDLNPIDYCKYKPKGQRFDSDTLKELCSSLNIENLITQIIESQKEVIIQ